MLMDARCKFLNTHCFLKSSYKSSLYVFFLYFSLKLECEKLASEKIEIQRHYVMVSIGEPICAE